MIEITNTVSIKDIEHTFNRALRDCAGEFPSSEGWQVHILEPEEGAEYLIEIRGPGQFLWQQRFFGPTEVNASYISDTIKTALKEVADG